MAVYFSRRKLHPREQDEVGELNIVPYLDIMMNLIMFMLLTMTALITLGVLNVTAPSTAGASAGDSQKPPLTLNVSITRTGFFVAAIGGVLPGTTGGADQPTIPLKNGEFDYDSLTQKMIDVKKQFPTETKIIIAADASLPYQSLIHTMDAVREYQAPDGKHPLFFDVSLSAGVYVGICMSSAPASSQDDIQRIEFKKALRRVRRKARERQGEIKELNITAMMDMMTIILVFLLKSWSSSNTTIEMNNQLQPPVSTTQLHPEDTLTVTISQKAILVGDKPVVILGGTETPPGCPGVLCGVGVKVDAKDKEGNSDESFVITPLFDRLTKEVDRLEYIAKYNPANQFTGRVTIICDRYVPYRLLTEVLYTAGRAKLDQYKFLVLSNEKSG